jgi:hypothetical protein
MLEDFLIDFDVLKVTKNIAEEVRSACNTNNLNIIHQDQSFMRHFLKAS